MIGLTLPCILILSASLANIERQSSWIDGPGVPGPLSEWESYFYSSSSVCWWAGDENLRLTPPDYLIGGVSWCRSITIDDIDGDGNSDVIAGCEDEVVWWHNVDGSGETWVQHDVYDFEQVLGVETADFDGDGITDIVAASIYHDMVVWWRRDPAHLPGDWTINLIAYGLLDARDIEALDMDGDGDIDVAACGSREVVWYENADGAGGSWVKHRICTAYGTMDVCAGDIDGDGDADAVTVTEDNGPVVWWENGEEAGADWTRHVIDTGYSVRGGCSICDIDSDGYNDIVVGDNLSNGVVWFRNPGDWSGPGPSWVRNDVSTVGSGCTDIHTDDVDGDGDPDIISLFYYQGGLLWWENADGTGTLWMGHYVGGHGWSVDSGDLDNDGITDIVAGRINTARRWEMELASSGHLESSILYLHGDPGWGELTWESDEFPGAVVTFQVRASDDPSDMGPWSDTLHAPCRLDTVLPPFSSHFQYRAILHSDGSARAVSPMLKSVSLLWDPVSIEDDRCPLADRTPLFSIAPNPAAGPVVVTLTLPADALVSFQLFDVSGRIIDRMEERSLSRGRKVFRLSPLEPGVYFLRMRCDRQDATRSFVVAD